MDHTINFNEKNKKKQTNEKTKRKKNRQPEGLYIPGSSMLVLSRRLLDS